MGSICRIRSHIRISGKRDRFGNVARKTVVDGIVFDSKAEADYYVELKLRKKAGDIVDFKIKPKYTLIPKNDKFRETVFRPDFLILHGDRRREVVDVKGAPSSEVFKLKQKLLYHLFGLEVQCVRKARARRRR